MTQEEKELMKELDELIEREKAIKIMLADARRKTIKTERTRLTHDVYDTFHNTKEWKVGLKKNNLEKDYKESLSNSYTTIIRGFDREEVLTDIENLIEDLRDLYAKAKEWENE